MTEENTPNGTEHGPEDIHQLVVPHAIQRAGDPVNLDRAGSPPEDEIAGELRHASGVVRVQFSNEAGG